MGFRRYFIKGSSPSYFTLILLSAATVVYRLDSTSAQSIAPDNLVSTAQIVVKSCYFPGINDEKTAWRFFACYDQAPGKQLFIKCQKKTFNGRLFNNVRNTKMNCAQPQKLPSYARCLMNAFRKAGLDMNVAVRKLNACQLPVVS